MIKNREQIAGEAALGFSAVLGKHSLHELNDYFLSQYHLSAKIEKFRGREIVIVENPYIMFKKKLLLINVGEQSIEKHWYYHEWLAPGAIIMENVLHAHPDIYNKIIDYINNGDTVDMTIE